MSFFSWLRHRPANRALFRPRLEGLEDRALPSTTLTVSSLADSGKDTLRSAIQTADQHPDKTYTINISVAGAISLKSSLPDLAGDITINGQDTIHTLIQRDALAAPFRIVTVGGGFKATLSKLAIAQGNAGSGNGGAIDNRGTLILTDCSLNSH